MKYTALDIKITKIPVYESNGLAIDYSLDGGNGAILLSETDLHCALLDCRIVWSVTVGGCEPPRVGVPGSLSLSGIPIEKFMMDNLNEEMSLKLVLNYLNNKPEKP